MDVKTHCPSSADHVTELDEPPACLKEGSFLRRKLRRGFFRPANEALEAHVRRRTADLTRDNESLRREIGEHVRVEAARALLGAMVESSKDVVISKDPDGTITGWNVAAEHLLGYRANEMIGQSINRIIPPEFQAEEASILECLGRGQEVVHFESVRLGRDGSRIPVCLTISPTRDAAGAIIGGSRIARDLEERKQAEETLRAAMMKLAQVNADLEQKICDRTAKLQETLAEMERSSYAIVHDLRAPLRAMHGFAEVAERQFAGCEQTLIGNCLHRIKTASESMDDLVRDLLSYSKAAHEELPMHPVALCDLLYHLVDDYPNLHSDKADIEIQGDLPVVLGNEAALTQCFCNLLGNAVKFAKSGQRPQIHVRAQQLPPLVRIWVEDNGIGIPKESQERIFVMFQRANTDCEGTGIGLAIVRRVAQRMGGAAGVESEEGKGSRFWVNLALAA